MKNKLIIPINATTRLVFDNNKKYKNGYICVQGIEPTDYDGKIFGIEWDDLGKGIGIDSEYTFDDLLKAMTRLQKLLLLK